MQVTQNEEVGEYLFIMPVPPSSAARRLKGGARHVDSTLLARLFPAWRERCRPGPASHCALTLTVTMLFLYTLAMFFLVIFF